MRFNTGGEKPTADAPEGHFMHTEFLLKIMRPHSSQSPAIVSISNERAPNHVDSSLAISC